MGWFVTSLIKWQDVLSLAFKRISCFCFEGEHLFLERVRHYVRNLATPIPYAVRKPRTSGETAWTRRNSVPPTCAIHPSPGSRRVYEEVIRWFQIQLLSDFNLMENSEQEPPRWVKSTHRTETDSNKPTQFWVYLLQSQNIACGFLMPVSYNLHSRHKFQKQRLCSSCSSLASSTVPRT